MQLFSRTTDIDFLRWRWHALALSAVVIVAGLVTMAVRGVPLGIDFSGGTIVVLKFEDAVSEQAVREALAGLPGEKVVQQFGRPGDHQILVRLPELVTERGTSLEQGAKAILGALEAAKVGRFEIRSTEIVGPVIGKDLQRKGVYATLASLVGILAYIALRFRLSFAVGAIVATLHDILVTLSCLTFFGYELSLNVVAALLTITGYSVNDTIVIFDRVRENLRTTRRDALAEVVNRSVNQTLSRTIITAGTTFLAVLALFLFGGEVLHGFAFTMLVGIVTGTYSTVFIAAAVAIIMSQRRAEARAGAPAAVGAPGTVKSRKASRKVRAS
jgi:preprotein translocase subunit SecF